MIVMGFAAVSAGLCLAGVARASGPQDSWVKLGASLFGNDEKSTYGNFEAGTSLNDQFNLRFIADATPFRTYSGSATGLSHGGTDFEALGTYHWKTAGAAELSIGMAVPNTPARNSAVMTYRGRIGVPKSNGWEVWADSYGLVGGGAISMFGIGLRYDLGAHLKLDASAAMPIQGNNSIDPTSGNFNRSGVFSIGFSLPSGSSSLAVALTNQTGWTTGMSATPALGGFAGVRVSYEVKF